MQARQRSAALWRSDLRSVTCKPGSSPTRAVRAKTAIRKWRQDCAHHAASSTVSAHVTKRPDCHSLPKRLYHLPSDSEIGGCHTIAFRTIE